MRGALFFSLGLCGLSIILNLLILIAGSNKHVLVDWFFLKTNTEALSVAAKLSNSTFLKDLSTLTGNDLVGTSATASSLGLANDYTVSLFTSCAENNSSTTCTTPKFGYHFNPLSDLKLDNTGMQGSSLLNSISSYGSASNFLGAAYIFALLFTLTTQAFNVLSCCAPRAIIASVVTSIVATGFLLGGSIAALAVFISVKGKFNTALLSAGIKTAVGNKLFILSWIATVLLLLNSVLLLVHHRRNSQKRRQRGMAKGIIDHSGMDKSGADEQVFAAPKRTRTLQLLKSIPSWNKQKYTQIEKQQAVKGIAVPDDEDVLVRRGFGGGEDEEDEEQELVRGSTRGIPLQPFGKGPTREADSAYEPYRQSVPE